jgi:hypothetical protein
MKPLKLLFILGLLLVSVAQAASLTTLQLRNRTAAEVIPIIEPMLEAGDVITGHGYKIFLRARAQTVSDVQAMIDALDTAPQMLQISVFQGSRQSLESLHLSGSLRIEGDDGGVGIGNSSGGGAATINYDNGSSSASASADNKRLKRQSNPLYQVRVAEGNEAFIETGDQVPYSAGDDGTVFQSVTSGFYVLPRIHGDSVTLQVSPFKNALSAARNGSIETQSANTTLSGRVGEWLQVGSISEQSSYTQSGTASYSSGNSKRTDRIWIRADLLR